MPLYRLSNSVISRSKGKSAVAAAAYRSASVLKDERSGEIHDYSKKGNVAWTMILAPDFAPDWVGNREELWNRVEAQESRRDSQVARECLVALPKELALEQNIVLVRDFALKEFVGKGMIADVALHDISGNPHAHILLTMRSLETDGFGLKNRDWNHRSLLKQQRQSWEDCCNEALESAGIDERVDHRTLAAQEIIRIPQIHLGSYAAKCLKEQKYHPRLERYFEIEQANLQLAQLQSERSQIEQQTALEIQQQFTWASQILPVASASIVQHIESGTATAYGSDQWGIQQDDYQIFLIQPSETEWELEVRSQRGSLARWTGQNVEVDQGFTVQDSQYFVRLHQSLQFEQQRLQAERDRVERERLQREQAERDRIEREQQERIRLEQERLQQFCQTCKQVYDRIAGTVKEEANGQIDLRVADQAYESAIAQGLDLEKAKQYTRNVISYGGAIGQEMVYQQDATAALQYAEPLSQQAAQKWQSGQAAQILKTAISLFRHQANADGVTQSQPNEFSMQCDRYSLVARIETTDTGQERRLSVITEDRGEIARCRRVPGISADEWKVEVAQNIQPVDLQFFQGREKWLQQQQKAASKRQLSLG